MNANPARIAEVTQEEHKRRLFKKSTMVSRESPRVDAVLSKHAASAGNRGALSIHALTRRPARWLGDCMSLEHIEKLYKTAQKLLAQDETLNAKMSRRLAALKESVGKAPGCRLRPFRERGTQKGQVDWWIIQWRCGEKPIFHLANEPPPGYGITVSQSANPGGPFRE